MLSSSGGALPATLSFSGGDGDDNDGNERREMENE